MGSNHDRGDIWLSEKSDRSRLRAAQDARRNRKEITKALSQGQASRRDLVKWGLFTTAGILAPVGGLNPFVRPVNASSWGSWGGSRGSGSGVPTGLARSPLFGVQPF